jgi:hypothetical protein
MKNNIIAMNIIGAIKYTRSGANLLAAISNITNAATLAVNFAIFLWISIIIDKPP